MLAPETLIGKLNADRNLPQGTAMFCGTLPVIGTLAGGERFEVELEDPVLKRSLRHGYDARVLPYAD
jgi:hypothetical protein